MASLSKMSDTILDHDSLSLRVSSPCFVHSDKQRISLMRIATDKMSHAATPPMVLADRGYGTHQSVLQRFHPIKLAVVNWGQRRRF